MEVVIMQFVLICAAIITMIAALGFLSFDGIVHVVPGVVLFVVSAACLFFADRSLDDEEISNEK